MLQKIQCSQCIFGLSWAPPVAAFSIVECGPCDRKFCSWIRLSLNSLSRLAIFCERFSARNILKSPDVSITFSHYSFSRSCIHCTGNSRSGLRRRMHRWHHKRLARKLHNAHEQGLYRNCKHLLLICCIPRWWFFSLGRCNQIPDYWANRLKVCPVYYILPRPPPRWI